MDTSTLAEDTVTTFETQLGGRRAIFEPHATVWAEEPGSIVALWHQRLRWARGNMQVTRRFASVWFRPQPNSRLGSISFGLIWFCLLLLPVFMLLASASLVTLFFIDYQLAWTAFHVLWLTNVVTYVFITSFALLIDPGSAGAPGRKRCCSRALVNVTILVAAILPGPVSWLGHELLPPPASAVTAGLGPRHRAVHLHLAGRPAWAWPSSARWPSRAGSAGSPARCSSTSADTGPLLCAITAAAYVKELRHAEAHWDKTEKTGKEWRYAGT